MKGHEGNVNYLAFNPSGKVLASASTDLTIKLWNLETKSSIKTLKGHEHEVSGLAYLPTGDFLLSCSRDSTIRVWDTQSGFCLTTLKDGHSEWIRRIAVNESRSLFASACKQGTIICWNTESVKKQF